MRKCLAKDSAERAQSAGDLVVDVKLLARDVESGTAASAPPGGEAAGGGLAVGDLHIPVYRESGMPPGQQVVDDLLGDHSLAHQQAQYLGAKQPLDQVGVEEREAVERPVATKHPVVRSLDDDVARRIDGTEYVVAMRWSPDSAELAFTGDGTISRVRRDGTLKRVILTGVYSDVLAWAPGGDLFYASVSEGGLQRVSADGGAPETLLQPAGFAFRSVEYAAPGPHLLLHQFGGTNGIYAVNDNGSDRRVVVPGIDSSVRFLPPDGTRLLYIAADPATGNQDLWLTDLRGGAPNRVSTGPDVDHLAAFSPDGSEVVWEQHAAGNLVIMRRPTDLSAPAEMLMEWNRGGGPTDWSPDGTFILYGSSDDETQGNLWAVPLDGGEQRAIIDAPFDEDGGRFSPDGNWLAYTSDESGRREIYIQRLEGTDRIGGPQRVSSDGGVKPQWRGDGRELFFLQGTMLMAVDMDLAGDRPAGTPRELFDIGQRVQYMDYLVAPDGQSFTAIVQATDAPAGAATMIMNWGAGR